MAHEPRRAPGGGGRNALDVHVRAKTHGVYYELTQNGTRLGEITFPTNTRVAQFHPGITPTDFAWQTARRVAELFGFAHEPDIVDQ
jgi:hypothetical protein